MVLNKLSGNASTLGLVFCVCSSLWKLLWMFSVSLVRQPIYYCFYLNLCLCCPVKPLPKIKLRFGHAHTCLIPFYSRYACCRLLYIIRVFLYKYVMNSTVAFLVWVWIVSDIIMSRIVDDYTVWTLMVVEYRIRLYIVVFTNII